MSEKLSPTQNFYCSRSKEPTANLPLMGATSASKEPQITPNTAMNVSLFLSSLLSQVDLCRSISAHLSCRFGQNKPSQILLLRCIPCCFPGRLHRLSTARVIFLIDLKLAVPTHSLQQLQLQTEKSLIDVII